MNVDKKSKLAIKIFKITQTTIIQLHYLIFDHGKMYLFVFLFTINLL